MTSNELATAAADSIRDTVEQVGDRVEGLRRSAERVIDTRRLATADRLASVAESLHGKAEHLPGVDRVVNLTRRAADRIDATADYLRDNDIGAMAANGKQLVRRHPGTSLAAAAVLGFLAARALRRG